LVLDTEQCSKISRKGLEALLSERNKLVDERGSATKRKPGSGPAVGRKTARTEENVSYTLSCWLAKIEHWLWCCATSPNI